MSLLKRCVLWCVIFIPITCAVSAQPAINLVQTQNARALGRQTLFLEDPSAHLCIEHILSPAYQQRFRPYHQDTPNFRGTASAYWLKLRIQKEEAGEYYLEVGTAFMDSVSLYKVDSLGSVMSVRHSGDDLPFSHRELKVGSYLFRLDIPLHAEAQVYYLRVKSAQPLFFPLKAGTLQSFMEYTHDLDFVQGLYFGFMLLIFLYNLFIYFSIREKIYLLYVAYVASITLFMAAIFGYFFEYLWPSQPWINQEVVMFSGFTLITATLFTQHFLSTKDTSRWLHRISHAFLLAGIAVVILIPLGFKVQGLVLAQVALLLMALYFMFLGVYYLVAGFGPAKFYLTAWGCLVVGIFFGMLESFDIIPVVRYLNPMQMGSAAEVVLLSFALGDRINTYKRQKEQAQQLALVTARENQQLVTRQNEILEKKIKERTQKITEQNRELLQLNEDKNTLISIVAHDLRSPLTHIKAFLHLLKLKFPESSIEKNEYYEGMVDAANRMNDMITRVLDINAIEAREINLRMETADITEILRYVEKNAHFQAAAKNIEVRCHYDEEKAYARIDRGYLIQVLENLVSNALKFSHRNSHMYLQLGQAAGTLEITVKDEGPGISPEDQQNLFKQFKTLSARPTAGEISTGLGLSIVKKYVEAMKGTIRCESELGKGTAFIVSFERVRERVELGSKA